MLRGLNIIGGGFHCLICGERHLSLEECPEFKKKKEYAERIRDEKQKEINGGFEEFFKAEK